MQLTTFSNFRKHLKEYIDKVVNNSETVIINRSTDTGVVIMSLNEYNSLLATQHELSSKANERRLDSAIEKFQNGSGTEKKLIDDE
jgi:antitoxin YefM